MWRSTGDIHDGWESVKKLILKQDDIIEYNGQGCFNDMDMLTVGMYGKGNVGNENAQSDVEYLTQFALWCLFGSPLMIGCDVRNMTPATKEILTNKELIALNQDPECRGVINVTTHPWDQNLKVFFRHLSDGEYAIGFFNFTERNQGVQTNLTNFGLSASSGLALELTDAMTGEYYGKFSEYINVFTEAHDCKIFLAKLVEA